MFQWEARLAFVTVSCEMSYISCTKPESAIMRLQQNLALICAGVLIAADSQALWLADNDNTSVRAGEYQAGKALFKQGLLSWWIITRPYRCVPKTQGHVGLGETCRWSQQDSSLEASSFLPACVHLLVSVDLSLKERERTTTIHKSTQPFTARLRQTHQGKACKQINSS